jgi:hypothetical protein
MQTAYHFTTWETYQVIRETGLKLSPFPERHLNDFRPFLHLYREGTIWLYKNPLDGPKLIGELFYVAVQHHNSDVVRLRVDYHDEQAGSWLAKQEGSDIVDVLFRHSLSDAGMFSHRDEPIELLTAAVPVEQVHLDGRWNFLHIPDESKC